MNLSISSLAVASLIATLSGANITNSSVERPISEYCAMATSGYEFVDIAPQAIDDQYTLPAPFHTQPIVNYRLVSRKDLPKVCEIYLASN